MCLFGFTAYDTIPTNSDLVVLSSMQGHPAGHHLPMQNWLETLSSTCSVTSFPLTLPKAATAALGPMVQKSIGKPSLMLWLASASAAWTRISASACLLLTAQPTPLTQHAGAVEGGRVSMS